MIPLRLLHQLLEEVANAAGNAGDTIANSPFSTITSPMPYDYLRPAYESFTGATLRMLRHLHSIPTLRSL